MTILCIYPVVYINSKVWILLLFDTNLTYTELWSTPRHFLSDPYSFLNSRTHTTAVASYTQTRRRAISSSDECLRTSQEDCANSWRCLESRNLNNVLYIYIYIHIGYTPRNGQQYSVCIISLFMKENTVYWYM